MNTANRAAVGRLNQLAIFSLCCAAFACSGDSNPAAPVDAGPGYIGFRLEPETLSLNPGECDYRTLIWSGETQLGPDEVEFASDVALDVAGTSPGNFRFCAGDTLGDGDVLVRLAGSGDFQIAGRAFVTLPPLNDPDPHEPVWTRGVSESPRELFWSADSRAFYATTRTNLSTLDRWDAQSLSMVESHFIYGERAALIDDDRVAVGLIGNVGVYSLSGRFFETWFEASGWQPRNESDARDLINNGSSDVVAVGASNGQLLYTGHEGTEALCLSALVDLPGNQHIVVERHDGAGFVGQSGANGGGWAPQTGTFVPPERTAELSESGRYALLGPDGCWAFSSMLVNLQTGEATPCGISGRSARVPPATISRDESTVVFADNIAQQELVVASTDGCTELARWPLLFADHLGYDVSPDGLELAVVFDGAVGDDPATDDLVTRPLILRRFDLTRSGLSVGEAPPQLGDDIELDMRFLAIDRLQNDYHRVKYSPDGAQLAVLAADGRAALVDVATTNVRTSTVFRWGTAEPLPDGQHALLRLNEYSSLDLHLVDIVSQEIVRSHDAPYRVEAVFDDGYVLFHQGSLESVFVNLSTGDETPYLDERDDAWTQDPSVSPDGTLTCTASAGTETVCLGGRCLTGSDLGVAGAPFRAWMMDNSTCWFAAGQSAYSWVNGASEVSLLSRIPGSRIDATLQVYRLAPGRALLRTFEHLSYWEL